jgi:hypothetical protein
MNALKNWAGSNPKRWVALAVASWFVINFALFLGALFVGLLNLVAHIAG